MPKRTFVFVFVASVLFCACSPKAEAPQRQASKASKASKAGPDTPSDADESAKAKAPAPEKRTGDARIFTAEGDRVVEGPFPASELNPELEVLGKAVVAELNESSVEGLEALLIEREEYEVIFPELAANRLTAKIGWEYSWDDMTVETADEIRDIVKKYGGRDLIYAGAQVTTLIERTNVRLYRKVVLEAHMGGKDKEVERLGILGTMVEERASGDLSLLSYRYFRPAPRAEGEESNAPSPSE